MLGIQARLRLTPEQDATLEAFLGTMSTVSRTAYQRVATGKLAADRKAVYTWATAQGLTAHQAKAVATQVESWRTADQAVLDHRMETLRLRVDALERAVKTLDRQLDTPSKNARQFLSPKARNRLTAKRFHKHRSLCNKRQQLARLEVERTASSPSRVFGSRRLLAQRHRLNDASSPWTMESWRQEWGRKRQGSVTLIGDASHSFGNQSAQVVLETAQDPSGQGLPTGRGVLYLRLTDRQADVQLIQAAAKQGVSSDKLTGRMQYKRLSVPVTFSPQQAAQLHQAQALGKPITVAVSRQPTPKGRAQHRAFSRAPGNKYSRKASRKAKDQASALTAVSKLPEIGTYLHVAFDLPATPVVASRHQGTLGVDLNSWGFSYAAVNADGQLLKVTDPVTGERYSLKGDIVLPLHGKTSAQARHLLCQAVIQLVLLAHTHGLAIAIEALDFARKKAHLREMPPGYSRMLSRLTTAGFADTLASRCRKVGVALHRVAPAWTSVAGFAKYGMSLSLSVDQAAAFAIGRAAVLAKGKDYTLPTHSSTGKKLSPKFIRQLAERQADQVLHYSESIGFAKPLPTQHQRMLGGQGGLTWRSVRKALGSRETWPEKWSALRASAAPASVQEVKTSRHGGNPEVSGRPVRPLATWQPPPVKGVAKNVHASTGQVNG